ncbi:hypothetical protein RND81_09G221400 [Saponaria officinalis]|uniref:CUE domain-containing protein n=1 Tax=Saponaria officinalis TaxID=3572 RepID=A0AAW1IR30_SAPOF
MAALVCGKRSFDFEDELESYYPSYKKHRCSSSYLSPITSKTSLIEKLKQFFPLIDTQTLDKTLVDCNFDLDLTINTLRDLCLASSNPVEEKQQLLGEQVIDDDLKLGEQDFKWVDLFVKEMTSATCLDNAKTRAARVLAARDKEKSESTYQPLTEQNVRLSQENAVLKRLVVAQHERIKGLEETKNEMEKLSGMLTQCREELRLSQMNNYALKVHITQAQYGCSSMINPTNFPPDVY